MSDATSVESRYPTVGAGWWMAGVFCFAGFVSYTDRLILSALVEPIRLDLAISDSQISLLQGAAFAIVYVFAGLMLGRLADRVHRLSLLLAGAALWCIGTAVCGLVSSFWQLFAARMVIGVGEAALAPAAVSMIADTCPPARRGAAVSLFVMGTVVGGPAAIAVGGTMLGLAETGALAHWPLLGALAPWRIVLVVVGVAGLIVPILFLTLTEPARRERAAAVSIAGVARNFVRDKAVLAPLYIAMALLAIGDFGLLSWAPSLLLRRFNLSPGEVGMVFAVITAAAGVFGSLAGGFLSDVAATHGHGLRARVTVACVAVLGCLLGAVLVAGSNVVLVLAGVAVWTFASAVASIGGIVALQEFVPNEQRGVGISLVAFCNILLGLGFGPTLVAQVTERVYGDPVHVGPAIATVVVPAASLAMGLFVMARRALMRSHSYRAAELMT